MPTPSTRLALAKPGGADPFLTADIAANWQKIDDAPGITFCTEATRPAWNADHIGMIIYEIDTQTFWRFGVGEVWTAPFPGRIFLDNTLGGNHSATSTDLNNVASLAMSGSLTIRKTIQTKALALINWTGSGAPINMRLTVSGANYLVPITPTGGGSIAKIVTLHDGGANDGITEYELRVAKLGGTNSTVSGLSLSLSEI